MPERSYTFAEIDKSRWGDGPWLSEPDKVVWVDDRTGLDCMIVRNRVGSLCGYVGVPEGHPWFEVDYDNIVPPDIEIHGGLTFASHCQSGKVESEQAICHDSEGRLNNVWWLGFDCAHLFDLCPAYATLGLPAGWVAETHDVYRDLAYVKDEVQNLANQASRAGR